MKSMSLRIGTILLVCICLYMIGVGANGKASAPKQHLFIQKLNTPLNQDASYYLKGITVPDRVSLDFSHVELTTAGTYDVIVHDVGGSYTFQIQVIK